MGSRRYPVEWASITIAVGRKHGACRVSDPQSNQQLVLWNLDRPDTRRRAPLPPSPPPTAAMRAKLPEVARYMTPSDSSVHAPCMYGPHARPGDGTSLYWRGMPSIAAQYESSQAVERLIDAHARAITDLNWSPAHPDVLASCSVDTWVKVWDMRMPTHGRGSARPARSFSSWNASMTQVKWSRTTPHRIAASCDNKVLIWDDRFGSLPLATLETRCSKIYGVDWSPPHDAGHARLMTCSLDGTIHFWDLESASSHAALAAHARITQAEFTIETPEPVWRARHVPFGHGAISIAQRGDSSACLWAYGRTEPVHRFEGHTDLIKEFVVRHEGAPDDRAFQLITWSQDQTLRLWPINANMRRCVNHDPSLLSAPAQPPWPYSTSLPRAMHESLLSLPVGDARLSPSSSSPCTVHEWKSGPSTPDTAPRSLPMPKSTMQRRRTRKRRMRRVEQAQDKACVRHGTVVNAVEWMAHVTVGEPNVPSDDLSPSSEEESDDADDDHAKFDPGVLPQEILRVSAQYPNIFESIDIAHRRCTVAVSGPWHREGDDAYACLRVMFTFPLAYPSEPPAIEMERSASIPFTKRAELYRMLVDLIEEHAVQRALCLETCVQHLLQHQQGEPHLKRKHSVTHVEHVDDADHSFLHSYHAVSDAVMQLTLRSTDMLDASLGDLDIVQLMSTNVFGVVHHAEESPPARPSVHPKDP